MAHEFKPSACFALVVSVACGLVVLWQKSDGGLEFARHQLRADAKLSEEVGSLSSLVANKARYLEQERQYWVVVIGSQDSVIKRLAVHYVGGNPQSMVLER